MNVSDGSVALYHARAELLGKRCEERIGGEWGTGRFSSTTSIARDMLEMTRMLRQKKLLYWGFVCSRFLQSAFSLTPSI